MRRVERADLQYNQISYALGGWPTNYKINILQRFSHRSESSDLHIRLPSPGVQHREDKPPEHLSLGPAGLIKGAPSD